MNRCAELNYFEEDLFIVPTDCIAGTNVLQGNVVLKSGTLLRLDRNDRTEVPRFRVVMGFNTNGIDISGTKIFINVRKVRKLSSQFDLPNKQ